MPWKSNIPSLLFFFWHNRYALVIKTHKSYNLPICVALEIRSSCNCITSISSVPSNRAKWWEYHIGSLLLLQPCLFNRDTLIDNTHMRSVAVCQEDFMNTKIWISYNFHIIKYFSFYFSLPFKNMKSTLNSKAILKIDSGLDLTSGSSFADLFRKS